MVFTLTFICIILLAEKCSLASSWLKSAAVILSCTSIYPLSTMQPQINIPTAITRFYPLPEEELLNSYSRGNSYLVQGQFKEALRELNRALDVSPDNMEALMTRGITFEKLLRWTDAINDYKHANSAYKSKHFGQDDPTAISNIANAETGLQDWPAAMKDFTYASKLKSDFLAPQIGRALVSYELGDKQSAMKFFHDLTEKYPSFPDAAAAYAVMLFEEGDMPQASSAWDDALELDDRYADIEWVRDIRRWPPQLVSTLTKFLVATAKQ